MWECKFVFPQDMVEKPYEEDEEKNSLFDTVFSILHEKKVDKLCKV